MSKERVVPAKKPSTRRSAGPPLQGIALVLLGLVLGFQTVQIFRRHTTLDTSIEQLFKGKPPIGQAIHIEYALIRFSNAISAPEFDKRDAKGKKHHRFAEIKDPDTGRTMLMAFWRDEFPGSVERAGGYTRASVRGTFTRTPYGSLPDLRKAFPAIDPGGVEVYLDDMWFDPLGLRHILLGVFSLALAIAGVIRLAQGLASSKPVAATPSMAAAATQHGGSSRPREGSAAAMRAGAAAAASRRTCAGCGSETPVASRQCTNCRAPIEVEYYVAASAPFEGFERFVPVVTRVLGVSDYQAREPLARVHTPLPYQHLDSFFIRGPGEGTPFRIVSRGIGSLVTAQALASELRDAGTKAHVIGSDELLQVEAARGATELRYSEDDITFSFDSGGEKKERVIRWSRVCLVVFSAEVPIRGTMTIARDVREGSSGKDSAAYLLDIYELDQPQAIRIAEEGFYRWEFLKLSGSERPADRFGRLLELVETNATDADFLYVTGAYRGPTQPWRINYYSRLTYLIGAKNGWARDEGVPKLDGYELLEKVGQGAMGAVYRAKQRRLGRMAAVKVVAQGLASQGKFIERFKAEARAVAAMAHPNIVQVIDLVEQRGRYFMIMEFVDGSTLGARIKAEKHVSEADGLRVGLEVARALEHASRRGIIHRDVKPENIFLTSEGTVKLGDWGLAKELEQDLGLTDTGTALGTPFYMSPEQASAKPNLDIRSDLYSLGATVYHAISGQPPFRGGSPTEVLLKHLRAPAPDLRKLAPSVREGTARLVARLLEKEPDKRCRDASEIVVAFEQALADLKANGT